MTARLSKRLREIVDALPLADGARVLEIGCGPGAMAREMARRVGGGHILAIDRSETAITQAIAGSAAQMRSGRLSFRQVAAEDFALAPEERRFDFAVAIRVGALDGRHPESERECLRRIGAALVPGGVLYTDGGNPLLERRLPG